MAHCMKDELVDRTLRVLAQCLALIKCPHEDIDGGIVTGSEKCAGPGKEENGVQQQRPNDHRLRLQSKSKAENGECTIICPVTGECLGSLKVVSVTSLRCLLLNGDIKNGPAVVACPPFHIRDEDQLIAHHIFENIVVPIIHPRKLSSEMLFADLLNCRLLRLPPDILSWIMKYLTIDALLNVEASTSWLATFVRSHEDLWRIILEKLESYSGQPLTLIAVTAFAADSTVGNEGKDEPRKQSCTSPEGLAESVARDWHYKCPARKRTEHLVKAANHRVSRNTMMPQNRYRFAPVFPQRPGEWPFFGSSPPGSPGYDPEYRSLW